MRGVPELHAGYGWRSRLLPGRLTKPDPAIYRLFLSTYALDAGECVFVDDTEENVRVAKEVGFEGIVFSSPEQLTGALEALGIRNGKAL